jgi:hypothetical protein
MKSPDGKIEWRALGYIWGMIVTVRNRDWWKTIFGARKS